MVDAQTVYVDDSGTDSKSRIASAAFCVSTVEKWLEFGREWNAISIDAGFEHFHMTEFAACRRNNSCRQCREGKTTLKDHPWREWSATKRETVLERLAGTVVKYVEYGFGIAHTKQDYDDYVRNSPARLVAREPIGDQYLTYAIQQCGGQLAKWRAAHGVDAPLKFVFDLVSDRQRDEIARVFFAAASGKIQAENGVDQWFNPVGISYESRKSVVQLLAPDMLAWASATIRARELYERGRLDEIAQLAMIFVSTEHIRLGRTNRETLREWERNTLTRGNSMGS